MVKCEDQQLLAEALRFPCPCSCIRCTGTHAGSIRLQVAGAWWADPAGGIIISLVIMWRWYEIAAQQVWAGPAAACPAA